MKNTPLKTILVALIITFGLPCFMTTAIADIAVIVNTSSSVSSLTLDEVKKLFLGKKKKFPGGGKASPVEQVEGSTIRNTFNAKVLSKSGKQLQSYWSKIIFSGKGTPPDSVANDMAVKSWVITNRNGIGYIDSSQVDGSVKVILTVKE